MKRLRYSFLLFLCIAFLSATGCNSAHAESSSTPGVSSSFERPDIVKQSQFIRINMTTVDSGYAITPKFHLLRTSNGGNSWSDILTIVSLFSYSDQPALFVLNDKTVYIASYTTSGVEIRKSTDSGESWSKSAIKMQTDDFNSGYGGSLALSFIDQSDGFLLTSGLPAAGLMGKAFYKTSDGGNNWSLVGGNSNPTKGSRNIAGINGYTTGMAFLSKDTGYITCKYHGQNEISVYKTADSGTSWSVSSLPLPNKYASFVYDKNYYTDAFSPAFFGENNKNAKMVLNFCHDEERDVYIYSSDNEGTDWHINGISNHLMKKYCFVDDKNGFGLDENGTLYRTNNGGITWSAST
jgi:photosystem II stability/assembly factor-like uncharacterized protein